MREKSEDMGSHSDFESFFGRPDLIRKATFPFNSCHSGGVTVAILVILVVL